MYLYVDLCNIHFRVLSQESLAKALVLRAQQQGLVRQGDATENAFL